LNTRYEEHISEIKFKKINSNLNFAKHVLENDHFVTFNIDNDLEILNIQHNIYIDFIL